MAAGKPRRHKKKPPKLPPQHRGQYRDNAPKHTLEYDLGFIARSTRVVELQRLWVFLAEMGRLNRYVKEAITERIEELNQQGSQQQ